MNRRFGLLLSASLFALTTRGFSATPVPLESLVTNPPFGKAPPMGTPESAAADTSLELRGVFSDRGEYFFSIYDTATRRSVWVGLQEAGNPVVVASYDQAKGSVEIDHQGRRLTLALKQAKVTALPPGALPAVPAGAPTPVNVVAGASPSPVPDEAARLAQIAEEIRRRRAMRAQALQLPGAQPGPPPNAQPPPKPATP